MLVLAAIALLVVFVMIGIVVGIFFVTIIFQRIVQSHVHLLHMRAEAKRFVVKDLAQGQRPVGVSSAGEVGGEPSQM